MGSVAMPFGTLATVTVLAACASGVAVTTDWDPTVDFSGFTTYEWIESESQYTDPFTHSRIRAAVNASMEARGFQVADSDADLALGYFVTTEERREFRTVTTGFSGGYRWGWSGRRRASVGVSTATTRTTEDRWEEGTIILALFDTGSQEMVWTGSATAKIDPSRPPQERQERIDEAVEKLMRDFPPGQ